ncbi:hypothetical protein DUZ99_06405 [Xylanibacillus composti]|uniref:Alpha-galactosidase NEW3 domain-containing protein n=1 Tax=Xylanibacillus composti TaxID=1572762 RepID=A0A8J4M3L8_9BACL|nr:NEW3 domain-containing protein [Xylanibacillus composti]MDT9724622.1 hypothetical protein [Xylanibacillus composti]GIQ70235.1 hypothetical protein XYCOK13_30590 [Xylanibacillus composti]
MSYHHALKKRISLLLLLAMAASVLGAVPVQAAEGVTLFTRYTNVSLAPGDSINYSVDIVNNGTGVATVPLTVVGMPEGWEYDLRGGGHQLREISVMPGESESVFLDVTVPLQVERGTYEFSLAAGTLARLPLTIEVTEKGTFQTALTTDQANLEGHADSSFSYSLKLDNRTAEAQNYALQAQADPGWSVSFMAGGNRVTSVEASAGATETISVQVQPPAQVKEGTYKIPITASNQSTRAELELEAVITGSYGLSLSTPTGRLSSEVTAGGERSIELQVTNTGTADLRDINLTYNAPVDWEVSFNPKNIEQLAAGQSTTVEAVVRASKKAIAGDYVTSMTATSPEASSSADFRIAVKGSMLWGWIGVLIIAAVLVGIYAMIRKYGRR